MAASGWPLFDEEKEEEIEEGKHPACQCCYGKQHYRKNTAASGLPLQRNNKKGKNLEKASVRLAESCTENNINPKDHGSIRLAVLMHSKEGRKKK